MITKIQSFKWASFMMALTLFVCSCSSDDVVKITPAVANFSFAIDATDKSKVTFTNTSTDALISSWNFGDGTAPSAENNPIHTYAEPGTFEVTLTATGKDAKTSVKKQNVVIECDFDEDAVIADAYLPIQNFTAAVNTVVKEIYSTETGVLTVGVADPEDPCNKVLSYTKAAQWDGIGMEFKAPFTSADFTAFAGATNAGNTKVIKMDVYMVASGVTVGEAGIPLFINLGKRSLYAWPKGRSQFLEGTITAAGEWQTITFTVAEPRRDADIDTGAEFDELSATDLFEFLPGGGNASDKSTYYFDNLRIEDKE